ncbi:MAG: hypothetical protein L6R48_19140 [Planctomycetes bacterium]|nr:hypothetical protein [Planctomycetota bacterium]
MAEEAADLGREVAALQAGGCWACDGGTPPFLHHLSTADQTVFIAHLMAGRLRAAIGMVADAAMRCGIRDAPTLLASGRVRLRKGGRVEFLAHRVPPELGVVLSHALPAEIQRAELARVLRKGGRIQQWGMRDAVTLPQLSQRDVTAILQSWPYKSRAGRPRAELNREQ